MARPLDLEGRHCEIITPSASGSLISSMKIDRLSTLSNTHPSQCSHEEEALGVQPAASVSFPHTLWTSDDIDGTLERQHYADHMTPTLEEESALFTDTRDIGPQVRIPSHTPVFNIQYTATKALQNLWTSSEQHDPEDFARIVPDVDCIELKGEGSDIIQIRASPPLVPKKPKALPLEYVGYCIIAPTASPVPQTKSGSKQRDSSNQKLNAAATEWVPLNVAKARWNMNAADFIPQQARSNADVLDPVPQQTLQQLCSDVDAPDLESRRHSILYSKVAWFCPPLDASKDTGFACRSVHPLWLESSPNPAQSSVADMPPDSHHNSPEYQELLRQETVCQANQEVDKDSGNLTTSVHHFSYLGSPVLCQTATPPSDSLAIICGDPKLKMEFGLYNVNSGLYKPALLWNASLYLDPVRYEGNLEILRRFKGSKLKNAVKGSVQKTYSIYGKWRRPKSPKEVEWPTPKLDPMNANKYHPDEMFFNAATLDAETVDCSAAHKNTRRMNFHPVKSHMSQFFLGEHDHNDESDIALERPATSDSQVPEPNVNADSDRMDLQDENISEADTTRSIHPELAITPLKILKKSNVASEELDPSCTISPLSPRKSSDQSSSDNTTSGDSADDELSSSDTSYLSSEELELFEFGNDKPHQSESELPNSEASSDAKSSHDGDQDNEDHDIEITQPSLPKTALPASNDENASRRAADIAMPRGPSQKSEYGPSWKPSTDIDRIRVPGCSFASHSLPGRYGSKLVRSPEVRDLHALAKKIAARDAARQNYDNAQVPQQLCLIAEERTQREFHRYGPMNIPGIGRVDVSESKDQSSLTGLSTHWPPRHERKQSDRSPSISGMLGKQDNTPPAISTPATASHFGARSKSPIDRPSAPTPSRMESFPAMKHVEFNPEQQGRYGRASDEGDRAPTSPSLSQDLVDLPPSCSEVSGPPSSANSPKDNSRSLERDTSGHWLAQNWNGDISQESASPELDDHEDWNTARPTTPTAPQEKEQPLLSSPAADSSSIGVAVHDHPPTRASATPQARKTSFVGSNALSYFDHSEPESPSLTKSVIDNVFKDFSGFQAAALVDEEFVDIAPSHVTPQCAIERQPTIEQPDFTSHHFIEDALYPSTEGVLQPFTPPIAAPSTSPIPPSTPALCSGVSRFSVISPILSRARAFRFKHFSSYTSPTSTSTNTQPQSLPPGLPQYPSARSVLFSRARQANGNYRANFRASSWRRVENRLQKQRKEKTTSTKGDDREAKERKESKKGLMGRFVDRVFGRGKGKGENKGEWV